MIRAMCWFRCMILRCGVLFVNVAPKSIAAAVVVRIIERGAQAGGMPCIRTLDVRVRNVTVHVHGVGDHFQRAQGHAPVIHALGLVF